MKVYSIGREVGCDIVINDRTDVISRRHAILNVMPSGKMTIVDQSSNGTYVNGIRISPNVPVPVTRKDNISFAHVARLDWNLIPRPQLTYILWGVAAVVGLVILCGGGWWGYQQFKEPDVVVPDTSIISRQDALIGLLYDAQTASEEMKSLKADIDREKERLESRPLSKIMASRKD